MVDADRGNDDVFWRDSLKEQRDAIRKAREVERVRVAERIEAARAEERSRANERELIRHESQFVL